MDNISATSAGTVTIGNITVNRIGLGTNRLTDNESAHELLKRAVDLEVNFIDTAYRYQNGASETTIGNTLAPYKPGLVIATKGGWVDAKPSDLAGFLNDSLHRLKLECVDLYQLHRVNPDIPIEDSVGALKKLQDEGKIRHIGLSEVTIAQIERANTVASIVSVQNQYNVIERTHDAVVDYCTDNKIVFIPWFPLGGLAGGADSVDRMLADLAEKYHITARQLALAWLLMRSPVMLPIPGTLSLDHLKENLAAGDVKLTDEDFQILSNAI